MSRALRSRRKRDRGYTVVEVMSAMTLFAIGAAGVIGMQRVTIQGGNDARRFDVASNIANEWSFRLQRDSMFWTLPDGSNPSVTNLATNTAWLKDVATNPNVWITPAVPSTGAQGAMSPAFDIFGRDLASGTGDHMFCAQYRLTWIADPGVAPSLQPGALVHAEVRVFWSRLEREIIGNCAAPTVAPDSTEGATTYHFVYATTAIRQNPRQ